MSNTFSKQYHYLPITILIGFNVFTLLLFIFGPVEWLKINELKVALYICVNLLALFAGYWVAVKSYNVKEGFSYDDRKMVISTVIIVSLIWLLPYISIRLGITDFNYEKIVDKVLEGFKDPIAGYSSKMEALEDRKVQGRSFLNIFNFLLSPFLYAFFPFSILYFKRFHLIIKIAVVIFFFLECISWISIGTNKGVVDLFLFSLFTGIIVNPDLLKFSVRQITSFTIIIILILYFFINNMLSRYGALGDSDLLYNLDLNVSNNPFKTTGIYADMSITVKFGISMVSGYLSNAYYNLALALEEPIIWTYGFGNSWMGLEIWQLFTGQDLLPETYLGLLQKKYQIDPTVSWHSIYTWLANDFTFWGVPFVIFSIGYSLARSWLDSIYKRSIYASVVFCLFSQMIFYFYANNQILSFSILPFIVSYLFWQIDRNNVKFKFY